MQTSGRPRPPKPRKSAGSGSRRKTNSYRPKLDENNKVAWATPMAEKPQIAIIGGGLAGLCCSLELARQGVRSVIFDTGIHGPGGRLGTRSSQGTDRSIHRAWLQPAAANLNLTFDHAAQFFTASDPRFQALVDEWLSAGVVRPWQGPVGTLTEGRFEPLPLGSPTRYVAVNGMRSLACHIEQQLGSLAEVRRPVWVSKMEATKEGLWKLQGEGKSQGTFDAVVIAHNGKCANRLVIPAGIPSVAKQLQALRLSAIWSLMVAFDKPLGYLTFEGAFIQDSPVLSWVGNNTAKLQLQHGSPDITCWTLLSTGAYGSRNKVPQEAIPPEVHDKVAQEMLQAFAAALGRPVAELPTPIFKRGQLWGAALPINSPSEECILDPESRVGVAGDWCAGSSMQAAAISGISLAGRLASLRGQPPGCAAFDRCRVGLTTALRPSGMSGGTKDIGQFPGMETDILGDANSSNSTGSLQPVTAVTAAR